MLSVGFHINIFEIKQSNLNVSAAPGGLSCPCWELKEKEGNRYGNTERERRGEKETQGALNNKWIKNRKHVARQHNITWLGCQRDNIRWQAGQQQNNMAKQSHRIPEEHQRVWTDKYCMSDMLNSFFIRLCWWETCWIVLSLCRAQVYWSLSQLLSPARQEGLALTLGDAGILGFTLRMTVEAAIVLACAGSLFFTAIIQVARMAMGVVVVFVVWQIACLANGSRGALLIKDHAFTLRLAALLAC